MANYFPSAALGGGLVGDSPERPKRHRKDPKKRAKKHRPKMLFSFVQFVRNVPLLFLRC